MVSHGPPLEMWGQKPSTASALELRVPGQLHSCSPESSWRIIHARAVTAALLHGIKETSGLQAQGWGSGTAGWALKDSQGT